MSDFYFTLNSDGSKDIHPDNHGGEFTIELYRELYFPDSWEVALVEMSYFGQYFPNVMYEDSVVTIDSTSNREYQKDLVLQYHDAYYVYIDYIAHAIGNRAENLTKRCRLPNRHYTWQDLHDILPEVLSTGMNQGNIKYHVYIWATEDRICIEPTAHCPLNMIFSDGFLKLFGISREHAQNAVSNIKQSKLEFTMVKPKVIKDDGAEILKYPTTEPLWININGYRINIPNMFWTVTTLNIYLSNELNTFFHTTNTETDVRIEALLVINEKKQRIQFKILCPDDTKLAIEFSPYLNKLMHLLTVVYLNSFPAYFEIDSDLEKPEAVTSSISFQLPQNYYATPKELIESLDKVTLNHVRELIKKHKLKQTVDGIFSIDSSTNICSFKTVKNFDITVSSFLQNLFHLDKMDESNSGKSAIVLPAAVRPYLYVESSLVEPHFINQDELPLLRVINNTARENERALISFNHLQYQKVSRNYFTNIHISISDYYLGILKFSKPVSFLLHFRPCHSS